MLKEQKIDLIPMNAHSVIALRNNDKASKRNACLFHIIVKRVF